MSSIVQSSDFLAGIGARDQEEILASATLKRFKAKEAIVTRGEPAKHLFMLRHGRVRYYKITKRGVEIVFRWLAPGDIFGLGTLLPHPAPYMGTAEALKESEVLVWTHASMRELLEAIPQIAENALRVVLQYLRTYADRHTRLVSKSAEERVADVLLILGHQQGQMRDKRISVEITNEQLSALADTSLFTTSRIMSHWARKGYISKQRGRVLITEPEALVTD